MDGITQADSLCFRNVPVSGCLPQLEEIDLDVDVRLGEGGVLEIPPYVIPQLCFGRFLLKLAGAVQDRDLLIRPVMLYRHDLLRQLHECAVL